MLVCAAAAMLGACSAGGGSDAPFPEDAPTNSAAANVTYRIEPDAFRSDLLVDPWIGAIEVGRGSTFGREIPRVMRIQVDGVGALPDRDITLQTPPTVELFRGEREQRMRVFVHGALTQMDEIGGFTQGFSLGNSAASYEAAALAGIIQQSVLDGELTANDKRFLAGLFGDYAEEAAQHATAWFDPRTTWIALGPELTTIINTHARTPGKVKPARGIFLSLVMLHEFQHAVTPPPDEDYERLQWLEEGGADVLASWPGAAAHTAKLMGIAYPKRYERQMYVAPGGYPDWANAIRLLLRAAGAETTTPQDLKLATELLQQPKLREVPDELARAIVVEQGLSPARRRGLARDIVRTGGDPARARRLVAAWL